MRFDIGDRVRITATFTDLAGAVADPTTVALTVKAPDGTLTSPSNSKDSTGVYHADVNPDASGTWWYRWTGTGALVAAEEGTFSVRQRQVGP